jgi:hypothetical protein
MPFTLTSHDAAALNARAATGLARALARKVGHARSLAGLPEPPAAQASVPGRVSSAGVWRDGKVHAALAAIVGPALVPALRTQFEWYLTRGAFFHNDAHYEGVLFGIWCVAGPPAELVLPRLGLRFDASPGALTVFDPFEVHGVLRPGRSTYAADDYQDAVPSVFVGFELELTPLVATAFEVGPACVAPTLSSATRINAATGAVV